MRVMTMHPKTLSRFCATLALAATGAVVSAQGLLPSTPPKTFGASVTPVFEGWFDNADGTHSFLIGYFNRNTKSELDIPIGPSNHFEPGSMDMGQPTHFLTGRRHGMFAYTVPRDFGKNQKLTWVLTANGVTSSVPFYMSPDYNISPLKASEEGPRGYNLPPALRFEPQGAKSIGPLANPIRPAITRTAAVGLPMSLDLWVDDDAQYASGANTAISGDSRPVVELTVSKYRGPGGVAFASVHPKMEALRGGKPDEPYSGSASTTATFDRAGDYMLHVVANDYSLGRSTACCWTTTIVNVSVTGALSPHVGGH